MLLFVLMLRLPPCSPLFPYTTLFRSERRRRGDAQRERAVLIGDGVRTSAESAVGDERAGHGLALVVDDASAHAGQRMRDHRSEEHTSELQSRRDLVCRLLLEKKNQDN